MRWNAYSRETRREKTSDFALLYCTLLFYLRWLDTTSLYVSYCDKRGNGWNTSTNTAQYHWQIPFSSDNKILNLHSNPENRIQIERFRARTSVQIQSQNKQCQFQRQKVRASKSQRPKFPKPESRARESKSHGNQRQENTSGRLSARSKIRLELLLQVNRWDNTTEDLLMYPRLRDDSWTETTLLLSVKFDVSSFYEILCTVILHPLFFYVTEVISPPPHTPLLYISFLFT